ncbi:MAG TPA: protease pro-enzyme activation domain-containing protein [Ktedonobacterales bacterium]|nr:protease pro-enzyme activation domain-containing protein [Ktedonobacterales bacterium]
MNRLLRREVAIGALITLALLAALAAVPLVNSHFTSHAAGSGRWIIRGHLVPAVRGRHALAQSPDTAQALDLSISLSLRNQSGLTQLLAAQNNPHSGLYHQYLSSREFQARFSPTQATVNQVTAWLRSQGLVVHSVAANHLLIDASGSVATVEAAFQTTLASYQVNGRTVYAPTTEPSVPDSLTGMIISIGGLNNVGIRTPAPIMPNRRGAPQPRVGSGPGGGYTPNELRTAYDMNALVNNDNGAGQTVAIFELDGYVPSDVNTYLSNYGLGSSKYSDVLVDGATNTAGPGAIEAELDMEVVSAIAPGASQKIYIGPNTDVGVNDTYNKIVTDNLAKVTSTSWGLCEYYSGTSELQTLDNIFQQGAAQGQAFFAASGDAGAYDCGDTNLGVDSPADDPNVVGVGGTALDTNRDGTYESEVVWYDEYDTSRGPMGAGSGGGLSTYFSQPAYQTGPGVSNAYSNGMREVPDVSADASPNTGYSMYCTASASGCPASGWVQVGGTSASAPLWAAIAADLNQYLAVNSLPILGSASATLYSLFNTTQPTPAYHDIFGGYNLYYYTTTGYDLATGIGSPDVGNIAYDLYIRNRAYDFSVTTTPNSQGIEQGGSGTFTINTAVISGAGGIITLKVNAPSPGLTVSLSPTTIPTGGSSTMTVNVSPTQFQEPYFISVIATEGSAFLVTGASVNVLTMGSSGPIRNGAFETGNLNYWSKSANTASSTTAHSGSYAARIGSTSPFRGDSWISQTFSVPSGDGTLTLWYRIVCPDTVNFDWATFTLVDTYTSTTSTILAKTCSNTGAWVNLTAPVRQNDVYTLTLTSHDDGYPTDPTYVLVDDITLVPPAVNPFVNPGFETNGLAGWTTTGAATVISGWQHSGIFLAELGSTAPFAGDSSISQTVTAPAGASTLTFWYRVICHDTVTYDWATATLRDNTTSTTTTVLPHTCTNNSTWFQATAHVTPGDSYTLTLTDHDDDWVGDPTYTFFDDVSIS